MTTTLVVCAYIFMASSTTLAVLALPDSTPTSVKVAGAIALGLFWWIAIPTTLIIKLLDQS